MTFSDSSGNRPSGQMPETDLQQLFTYRIEDAVTDRVAKWASRQFAIMAGIVNLVVLLGIGTVGYSLMKSALDDAVDKRVKEKVDSAKAGIEASVSSYRSLVESAIQDLTAKRGEIEKLRIQLQDSTQAAEKTAKELKEISDNSQKEFSEFKTNIKKTEEQMLSASARITLKYDRLQSNYSDWGRRIYQRSSMAVNLLSGDLVQLRAIMKALSKSSDGEKIHQILQQENKYIELNSKTVIALYMQTGSDKRSFNDAKWSLSLQARGFFVSTIYSGQKDYGESKIQLLQDTRGIEDISYVNDRCIIIQKRPNTDPGYLDHIRREFSAAGIPVDCLREEEWDFSDVTKQLIDASYLDGQRNLILAYFLER